MKNIGFIGLGTMGFPMAQNLLKAGFNLFVYNRTLEKAENLKSSGAVVMSSPAEVARESEVVFTILTADAAVEEVILGSKGIVDGITPGKIVVDSSTISPSTSKKVSRELSKVGVEMLDAPVTGSEPQAIEGILTFMVGGNKEVYKKCLPLFNAMGKKSFYMGESGAGSYTKLANNTIGAINLLSMAEGMVLAKKAGIDPQVFVEVVSGGGSRSGMIDNKAPKILAGDFKANFATALMCKDLRLATELASQLKVPVPVLSLVRQMLDLADIKGYSGEDMAAVIKLYEEWANVEVRSE